MKKVVKNALLATVLFTGAVAAAQTATGKSASTTLNVNLDNAYDIQIGQSSVSIDMKTPDHFQQGNDSGKKTGHVIVSSNTGFEVKVAAETELLNNGVSIPVSTVTVTPTLGAYKGSGTAPTVADLTLTQNALAVGTEKTIIAKNSGETKREYDVVYAISAEQANQYLNKNTGVYSTKVTYSLYAK
ncbi:MAG: hypothetical protein RIR67_1215 [Bacteroidota bacterium]|jgi:hypothetical protein|uniref:hypothetical protein n=1 Tax=Flavobacterium sp. TaxID=239 RepID=UPI00286EDD8C|nr:hypothetical protein [Flavobacterium sp.]